jgi:epoxyqueuosine reductase QueG
MTKERIKELITEIFYGSENNKVHLPEEGADITILEEPLIGYAAADDPLFDEYKDPAVIGEGWMSPREWMEDARTVIVFFFPYSEEVRSRAAASEKLINEAWKYGYPAGSTLSKEMTIELQKMMEKEGMRTLNPLNDPRMKTTNVPVKNGEEDDLHFIPAWSTRHGGYVAGLGTFGINRHIITEKGCCGSLTTLFTDLVFEPTERKYTGIYENCIKCGKCAERCPGKAITIENLRNLKKCSEFGGFLREAYGGGGCAKCMFGVPCEHSNPIK